jgi:choline monooxygenase
VTPEAYEDVRAELALRSPLPRAQTVPSAWFVEPRFERLDREAVFGRTWQAVGHAGELSAPGSWLTAEVAGEPVIVVRGTDDALRGFFNVCRHRGGPLATGAGCGTVLKCRYHGWTYTLEGTLRGVPQWDRVELFDRRDYGLVPLRVETWQGLVFVNLDVESPPLSAMFEEISGRTAPLELEALRHMARTVYDVRSNWKVYVENFLEGYHVPIVHPELVRLYDYTRYATEVHRHFALQSSPLQPTDHAYAPGGGEAMYYCVFPNFMLNILPGRLQTNVVVPTGPESCRVIFDYYYDDVESEAGRARASDDMAFAHEVQAEDMEICEHVQRGLASRAYDRGRFSVKFEAGVHWFQRRLGEAYSDWIEHARPVAPPPVLDPRHPPADVGQG